MEASDVEEAELRVLREELEKALTYSCEMDFKTSIQGSLCVRLHARLTESAKSNIKNCGIWDGVSDLHFEVDEAQQILNTEIHGRPDHLKCLIRDYYDKNDIPSSQVDRILLRQGMKDELVALQRYCMHIGYQCYWNGTLIRCIEHELASKRMTNSITSIHIDM